jgi:3-deoxy-manno-octulosonate cytidylyltransferase (CMP-KDO synthetase)
MKHIVIPARFASTRLSGKPLLKIHGREMILRVVDQAKKVEGFDDLCVATDDQRIYDLCMAEALTGMHLALLWRWLSTLSIE